MSELSKRTDAQKRENPEPWEGTRPIPWYVITVVVGLFLWAIGYIWMTTQPLAPEYGDQRTALDFQQAAAGEDGGVVDGARLYANHCVACHQATGAGIPGVFPPLAASEWVLGSPAVLVQILLHGVHGELTVNGVAYSGDMPAFGDKLNDAEMAAVATHLRTSFGNEGDAVGADLVAAQRTAVDRDSPWQGDADLSKLE